MDAAVQSWWTLRQRGRWLARSLTLGLLLLASPFALSEGSEEPRDEVPDHRTSLSEAYAERGSLVWTRPAGLTAAGESAIRWLRDAEHHGVDWDRAALQAFEAHLSVLIPHAGPAASDPGLVVSAAEVARALREPAEAPSALSPREARVALEAGIALALTRVVAELTHRPRKEMILRDDKGRYATPDALWKARSMRLPKVEVSALLDAGARQGEALDAWLQSRLPKAEQYGLLLEASKAYAALCEEGGWEALPVTRYRRGKRWKDGESIRALQERLAVEGFFKTEVNGVYDDAMADAVRSYQEARHLKARGRYTKETSHALNIPCEERLKTLRLNLKRWRQTARTNEATYVEVNLAGQEVRYVVDASERMRKRTVVGSGKWFWSRKHKRRIYPKKSPLLTDEIEKIVVNPSWTIPGSIIKQEILPRVEKDPTYLERKGYIIKKSKNGHDIYVQPPGPNNTLGEVKLLFPNAEAIYLHDTNNRYLFRTARRDLSHGCIRVQDALDFATALMTEEYGQRGKSMHPRALHRLSRRKGTAVFRLETPVPVFLEYYTASVDTEGIVRFHPDVYEYDLEIALGGPVPRRLPKALRR